MPSPLTIPVRDDDVDTYHHVRGTAYVCTPPTRLGFAAWSATRP